MKFIQAKTIISGYAEDNPWFGINYNMNISGLKGKIYYAIWKFL